MGFCERPDPILNAQKSLLLVPSYFFLGPQAHLGHVEAHLTVSSSTTYKLSRSADPVLPNDSSRVECSPHSDCRKLRNSLEPSRSLTARHRDPDTFLSKPDIPEGFTKPR